MFVSGTQNRSSSTLAIGDAVHSLSLALLNNLSLLIKPREQVSLAIIWVLIISTGCSPFGLPDRNLKQYVSKNEVIGSWTMTAKSLSLLIRDGFQKKEGHQYEIEIFPDGTCRFQSVRGKFQGGIYHEVMGNWKLEHDKTGDSNVKKKNTLQLQLPLSKSTSYHYLNFDKKDGKLILWNFYGDPDSWEFIEYTKVI